MTEPSSYTCGTVCLVLKLEEHGGGSGSPPSEMGVGVLPKENYWKEGRDAF
jgi:hypothetical protein